MSQANVSRGKAVRALRSNGMDIVNAIMVIKSLFNTHCSVLKVSSTFVISVFTLLLFVVIVEI